MGVPRPGARRCAGRRRHAAGRPGRRARSPRSSRARRQSANRSTRRGRSPRPWEGGVTNPHVTEIPRQRVRDPHRRAARGSTGPACSRGNPSSSPNTTGRCPCPSVPCVRLAASTVTASSQNPRPSRRTAIARVLGRSLPQRSSSRHVAKRVHLDSSTRPLRDRDNVATRSRRQGRAPDRTRTPHRSR